MKVRGWGVLVVVIKSTSFERVSVGSYLELSNDSFTSVFVMEIVSP